MAKKKGPVWTIHFKERLLERFAIDLDKPTEEQITEQLIDKNLFTVLRDYKKHEKEGVVYKVDLDKEVVMVLTLVQPNNRIRAVSAFRPSWFGKNKEGEYFLIKRKRKRKKKDKGIPLKKNMAVKEGRYTHKRRIEDLRLLDEL